MKALKQVLTVIGMSPMLIVGSIVGFFVGSLITGYRIGMAAIRQGLD